MSNVDNILQFQREYFACGETYDVGFRIRMLKKLYTAIKDNEQQIYEALRKDLNKPEMEAYMCEIGIVFTEIKHMLKHIKRYAGKKYRKTRLAQFGSKNFTQNCPYGNVLIVSPWNYPFLLTFDPLVHAIATGNTAIIKPSAYCEHSSQVIKMIIEKTFDEKYVACILGGREQNAELFDKKFDLVFFTGSSVVGREIATKCGQSLTPVLLELGGKSPCIVGASANLENAARRIVFGKLMNAGQTCVAPDYLFCHESIKDKLIQLLIKEIKEQFGENLLENPEYGKIINKKHFDRVLSLINPDKVVYGGKYDEVTLKIEPTIMDGVTDDDAVMKEEIFGPLFPIMTYNKVEEVLSYVRSKPEPLALYVFSEDKKVVDYITLQVPFGGGCINDTVMQLASLDMGFGGVGESGTGAYHGKAGFEAFSHKKSVNEKTGIDLPFRYRPYTKKKEKLIKKILN